MKRPYSALALAALTALMTTGPLAAQERKMCGTDEMRRQMIAENPGLLQQEVDYEHGLQAYLRAKDGQRDDDSATVYVLPLVFHILYDPTLGNDNHNISDAQILDAVNILNRDYAKMNADTTAICCGYQPIADNMRIQFQLATKDPYGNCTNGIDRITTQRSTEGNNFSKVNPWFRDNYINIWVVHSLASTGTFSPAGYSQLPPNVQSDFGSLIDGVILLDDYTGSIGTSSTGRSRTLTHEIGHFLNLKHTWGSTNNPGVACGDDGVPDTPVTKGHQSCSPWDLYDATCSLEPMDTTYSFNDVTTTSGTTDPTPPPTVYVNDTLEPGLTLSPFTAVGVSPNSAEDGAFAFSQWGTGATQGDTAYDQLDGQLSLGKYYAFTVTPEVGKSMTLSGISFHAGRSVTGPRTFAVRSSVDNFATNLNPAVVPPDTALSIISASKTFFFSYDTSSTVPGARISVSGSQFENVPDPISFRIYAFNSEDPDGNFTVDSVTVQGEFGIIENVQNYMEYSYCSHMFTHDQGERMRATLNSDVSGRSNLWQDANHAYTGTDGYEETCGPMAGFYTLTPFVCTGAPITFKDNSTRATPTSWAWSFDGGNPATSNDQNPTVTFDEPGYHAVTLTVSNDFGSNSHTDYQAAIVGAPYAEAGPLLSESFPSAEGFNRWPVVNYEQNQSRWYWESQVGHTDPGSAKLNASDTYTLVQDGFVPNYLADKDELVSPSLDLRFLNNIKLKFWFAYAARTAVMDEVTETLKVFSSTDCGEHWLQRKEITGGDLVTAGLASPGYQPGASDWREVTVSLPSLLATNDVRIKFQYSSSTFSNDIYIDDVNIDGNNVGIDELAQSGGLSLMPNPATDHVAISMDLASSSTGTLSILDMTGRQVYAQAVNAGQPRLDLDLAKLNIGSGVYLVRLKHVAGQRVERLVVQ